MVHDLSPKYRFSTFIPVREKGRLHEDFGPQAQDDAVISTPHGELEVSYKHED